MRAFQMPELTTEQRNEFSETYRRTKDLRVRTCAQMGLLACEQQLTALQIAQIVRENSAPTTMWCLCTSRATNCPTEGDVSTDSIFS